MKKLIGFINNSCITKIDSCSRRYTLFYAEGENDYSDIRICNHSIGGTFFDLDTGMEEKLAEVNEFQIFNQDRKLIFDSKDLISDDELVMQYGIIKAEFEQE